MSTTLGFSGDLLVDESGAWFGECMDPCALGASAWWPHQLLEVRRSGFQENAGAKWTAGTVGEPRSSFLQPRLLMSVSVEVMAPSRTFCGWFMSVASHTTAPHLLLVGDFGWGFVLFVPARLLVERCRWIMNGLGSVGDGWNSLSTTATCPALDFLEASFGSENVYKDFMRGRFLPCVDVAQPWKYRGPASAQRILPKQATVLVLGDRLFPWSSWRPAWAQAEVVVSSLVLAWHII